MLRAYKRSNKNILGKEGEQRAKSYLKERGYKILETNFKNKFGEIDIIAKKDGFLVFIEVKYRSTVAFDYPYEAVTSKKLKKLKQLIDYYYLLKKVNLPAKLEIIAIWKEGGKTCLKHIKEIIF